MLYGLEKVQILLSTYNGEKYLTDLMNSLLGQDYSNLEIYIRDDGSTDNTLKILERYKNLLFVKILKENNIGVIGSFFKLLEISSPDADYIAFCDQDDVWESDKITRAINILREFPKEVPLMYCSRTTLVNENLKIIGYSKVPKQEPSFGNALVQNIATGCTIVINNTSREFILKELPNINLIGMHDWWMYLVVSAFGKIIYDSESKILYRQHSSNVIGYKNNLIINWIARVSRFFKHGKLLLITKQAEEFRRIFGSSLPPDKKQLLDEFIDDRQTIIDRLQFVIKKEVYRQSLVDDIILRMLILLNRV